VSIKPGQAQSLIGNGIFQVWIGVSLIKSEVFRTTSEIYVISVVISLISFVVSVISVFISVISVVVFVISVVVSVISFVVFVISFVVFVISVVIFVISVVIYVISVVISVISFVIFVISVVVSVIWFVVFVVQFVAFLVWGVADWKGISVKMAATAQKKIGRQKLAELLLLWRRRGFVELPLSHSREEFIPRRLGRSHRPTINDRSACSKSSSPILRSSAPSPVPAITRRSSLPTAIIPQPRRRGRTPNSFH
jgi:hypothetical protein